MSAIVRGMVLSLAICAAACLFSATYIHAGASQADGSAAQAQPAHESAGYGRTAETASRKDFSEKIRQSYSFPFETKQIAQPGNAAVEGDDFIQPGAFPDAAYCGRCHKEAYAEWRQSLHSNSFRTPFYRTSVNILIRTKGIQFARHCDSCHNPIAVLSGSLDPHAMGDRSFDRDGVTCMTCHSVKAAETKLGNGSYTMAVPAVLVDQNGKRIPGIVPDAEILKHPDRHSRAVMQDFYKTPQLCSACHKASFPPSLNGYKWLRAFTTYDEWQQSKFSQSNPLTFYTASYASCQGCHMMPEPTRLPDSGAKHGMLASHRWPAGNTAVPFYYGFNDQMAKTVEFLKSGNFLNVDIFALRSSSTQALAAPLGSIPFAVAPADELTAYVVVQNKNIGHSLIPEVRDLYEGWVQFTVSNKSGHDIYRSGYLEPDGMLDPGAHSFTNRPVDAEGNFADNHKVWTIHSVAYDNSIQSGRSTLVRYKFSLPAGATGPFTIKAAVEYRHFRQSYLNSVFGPDHAAYPIVEIASATRSFSLGANAPAPAPATQNPDWMRWNNLGIAYIDQQQYEDARQAFEEVVKLRPEYKDGYINEGVNYIEWEKYDQARGPLEHALALRPSDARALYYLALVERRQRHSEAEIADLKEVVRQFPESRDARRELGISYYQQHRVTESVTQFQALQAIDPDDLAAHYNLAILYRRMGLKQEASHEAAQYAMKRIDPGAPTYSLSYLRAHPEISNESVPWHIHAETMHTADSSGAGQP